MLSFMNELLPLIPMFFFIASVFFRLRENAVILYQYHNLPIPEYYTWTIPLKTMRRQMESTENQELKDDLMRSIKNRKRFFLCIILGFLSMVIISIRS